MANTKFKIGSLLVRNEFLWYGTIIELIDDHTVEVVWSVSEVKITHQMGSLINIGWKIISDEKEILQFLLKQDFKQI
jgi:hypothetical protein